MGAIALGKACLRMMFSCDSPFQLGGLDIGRLHDVEDRRAGHAHHVRKDDEQQCSARQDDGAQLLQEGHAVVDGGDRREPLQLHGEEEDQQVADEEFRQRGRCEREARNHLVDRPVAVTHGQEAEQNRQRNGDDRRPEGEEQRVPQPRTQGGRNVLPSGQGCPQIACQDATQPTEIADVGRVVEAEFLTQISQRLRRRRLAEDRGSDVARKNLGAGEDERRHREEEEDAHRHALGDEPQDRRASHGPDPLTPRPSIRPVRSRPSSRRPGGQ